MFSCSEHCDSEDLSEFAGVFCHSCLWQVINCCKSMCAGVGNGKTMGFLVSFEFSEVVLCTDYYYS